MARTGINKALVQRARDALLARGLSPIATAASESIGRVAGAAAESS